MVKLLISLLGTVLAFHFNLCLLVVMIKSVILNETELKRKKELNENKTQRWNQIKSFT